jgi:hypothetical protein
MLSLTIFKGIYDNKTHRRMDFKSFDELEELLYKLSEQEIESKSDANLISPAVYIEDSTRKNDNVVCWGGWAAVDVDDVTISGSLEETLADMFPTWRYICYSTASSTIEQPKFRIVFALDKRLETEQINPFWHALQKSIGEMGDEQTKDKSRMYYIPAKYKNADNFIFSSKGKQFINTKDLMNKYPYSDNKGSSSNFLDRLPEEWRKEIIEYRKNKSDNTEFIWTSYLNCPFWPQKLANEYRSISTTGWYRKMYQIMVATAGNAVKQRYPIKAKEIADLCKQFDADTGKWYTNRQMESEADRAIEYVYRNM